MTRAFQLVKERVDIVDVARKLGIEVNRFGKAHCPWHADDTPSLSFYDHNRRFHCFGGCDLDGDVIDLVCKQQNLSKLEAVRWLNQVYHLGLDLDAPTSTNQILREMQQRERRREQSLSFALWEKNSFLILSAYFRALLDWRKRFAPKSPDETPDPRFFESLHQLDYIEYLLDEVYIKGNKEVKATFFWSHERLIRAVEQRLCKGGVPYADRAGTGAGTAASFWPVVIEGGSRFDRVA